ncbi:MAG: Two-component response regulator CbrB [Betaproteobacteria bacterium]|nr:Two-component response regulator CbrB [Betaproteobacteria bacterium]
MKKTANRAGRNERILVIEDDPGVSASIEMLLPARGYQVEFASRAQDGIERANAHEFELVITDLRLPDGDGMQIIRTLSAAQPALPIIMMTSYSSLDTAIEALRNGAVDYVIKPFHNDALLFAIERALNERRMQRENALLRRSLDKSSANAQIIGQSAGIKRVFELVDKVAPTDATVLIQGESGTGKELVAQAIHRASPRAEHAFVPINCGAIPAELLESELFGHTKGAYTGAVAATEGLIREAHGGTLFLDEISELAPQLQVKLLRVIQEKQVRPLGSPRVLHTDVRFLAASNRDLKAATAQGAFRADLFYRLNVINIEVPPLRDRGKDIELLAQYFIGVHSRRLGKRITSLGADVKELLNRYRWPGNVRELENVIERAVILADGTTLTARDFSDLTASEPAPSNAGAAGGTTAELSVEDYIAEFVKRHQDRHSEQELAAMLGIGRKALWIRRNKWGLFRAGSRPGRHDEIA